MASASASTSDGIEWRRTEKTSVSAAGDRQGFEINTSVIRKQSAHDDVVIRTILLLLQLEYYYGDGLRM